MKSALHKFFILCCALHLSGAHWMVLQATAWTGMIVARSQQATVVQAVKTTFDGKHPCRLCTAIQFGQEEEKQQQPEAPMLKEMQDAKLVALECFALPMPVAGGDVGWADFVGFGFSRTEAPPTPPPLA